jgi:hypothetical protein
MRILIALTAGLIAAPAAAQAVGKPPVPKPLVAKPAAEKPAAEKPAAEKLAAAKPAAAKQATSTIDSGMTRAQVVAKLGEPLSARSYGGHEYLLYKNGCEKKCGMNDLVVLDSGKVIDAVFRSGGRQYSGTSSSPKMILAADAKRGTGAPMKVPDAPATKPDAPATKPDAPANKPDAAPKKPDAPPKKPDAPRPSA